MTDLTPPLLAVIDRTVGELARRNPGPVDDYGPRGFQFTLHARSKRKTGSVIVSQAPQPDGHFWIHASIANIDGTAPPYEDLAALHRGVFGPDRYAYQVFAPASQHVNIHPGALHLWGRADGQPVTPEFGRHGTI